MADSPYYDEDPRRNAKRRRRRYEDDAWGQAEYADYGDGDYANVEDYAGGMVDEVGGKKRYYNPDRYDNDDQYTAQSNPVGTNWRSEHIAAPSDGMERASELMAKFNERNSIPGRTNQRQPNQPTLPPQQSPTRRTRREVDTSALNFTFALMLVVIIAVLSCLALGVYAFVG